MQLKITILTLLVLSAGPSFSEAVSAYDPPPQNFYVENIKAEDVPNDAGGELKVSWTLPADQGPEILVLRLLRAEIPEGPFSQIIEMAPGISEYSDQGLANGKKYFYRIDAVTDAGVFPSRVSDPAVPRASWFNSQRVSLLIALALFTGLVLFFIWRARKGDSLFVRKITGLSAVDEAIGRATEMGRPILYLPSGGLSAVSDIQTLASLVILGQVAEKAAEYETPLLVPCSDPLVMTLAQEIVKASYMNAGRPDAYRAENIRYLTNEQFAYTAGVDGIMIREKPAANFMIGTFYAESLILAETGYATGAIQIAGTAMITQLPFFVAACDYTLIGEEIYAASAYLSKEPVLMGTIKAQDWGKAIAIGLIIIGVIMETLALKYPRLHFFVSQWLSSQ
ncbi:MAG: fibronectin type III domain-containing protein [Candidatus Edwardsbacteria bacterium]|nr:fibronectin type III domain-containing protein [Candidatus Edwardsbacteria bacterium]MBU1577280.1 fibronectin type III domain-containing protein [Candidatus Edwardsbacteria bacterium]MBU2462829.1 fibronectin type III domain-containing protein [Candidatus Edwardsbacteria bacterium]MBU2594881.1 fibronectin type III domain-containing protein [Candidatus Edwardsbacteria bacterium]